MPETGFRIGLDAPSPLTPISGNSGLIARHGTEIGSAPIAMQSLMR